MKGITLGGLIAVATVTMLAAAPAAAQDLRDFDRLDRNRDGRISWQEFRRGVLPYRELGLDRQGRYVRGGRGSGADARTDATGRFERRTPGGAADRSGRLEPRDARDRRRGDPRLAWPLEWYDLNRDGRITQGEYNQFVRMQFNRYDRNNDGHITRREFAEMARGQPGRGPRPGMRY